MRKLRLTLIAFAAMAAMVYAGSAAAPATPSAPSSEHQRIIDFWTPARVAQAVPRDFVFNPATGRFELVKPDKGKPGGGGGGKPGGGSGGGTTDTTGSSWNKNGTVAGTTGKVLFSMAGSYYVCSASVVNDPGNNDRSIVLTAGHCVYDEENGAFAENWMFIPDYDAAPAGLTASGSFCADTSYGCWTAEYLTVDAGFASAGGFNTQATVNDVGFAVLGLGGFKDDTLVEDVVGGQNLSFNEGSLGSATYLFGYPAAKKYKGNDLVYCRGPLGTDPYNSDLTYRVACDMTGGSSGGPWFQSFDETTGTGTLMSVNSYGYSGVTAMHGPMFGSWTQSVYNAALDASENTTTSDIVHP